VDEEEDLQQAEDTAPQQEAAPARQEQEDPIASLGQDIMAEAAPARREDPIASLGQEILSGAQGSQKGEQPSQEGEAPQAEGMLASGARAAAHSVLPGVAGAAAFAPGAAAGAAIGSAFPGPGTIIGGVAGGLLSALGAGTAVSMAQEWLLNKLGFGDEAQQAANLKENPVATGVGSVAGMAATFGVGGAGALAGRVLRGGLIEGDAAQLIGRGVASTVSGGVDLLQTGDPKHAAAVAAGSGVAYNPTSLGQAALRGGEQLVEKLGIGGNAGRKFMTTLANAVHENPKNAEAEASPVTGATVDGAATETPKDPALAREAVQTSGTNTPGGYGSRSATPPPKDGIATGETQNTPVRDGGNKGIYAKDAVPGEEGGATTPAPLGTLNPDIEAVMRPKPEPAPEAPVQQAQQDQAPAPRAAPVDRTMDLIKSLQDAETTRTAARENPPSEFDLAAQKAVDAAANSPYRNTLKAGRQQDEAVSGPPGGGKPPPGESTLGGAPPPEPPKKSTIAPAEPTTRYKEGEKSTPELAAETVNRGFDNLSRNQNARWHEFKDALKSSLKTDSTLEGKRGEDLYHAIERGEMDKLDPKTKAAWDKFAGPRMERIAEAEKELVARGIKPAEEIGDPTHIHRLRNMPFSLSEWLNRDPTGMMRGMSRPDPFKALEYRGATAADGTRITLQDMSPNKYGVWKNGEQRVYSIDRGEDAKGFKNGDKIEYNGKEYTVDRGLTSDIEKHARDENGEPLKYKKNAALSLYEHEQQVKSALEHDDMIRTFKNDSALNPFREKANTPEGQAKLKQGWKELHGEAFKDFEGIVMHPDMAQAIRNNFDPGLGMHASSPINLMRAVNQFAVRSIFWNPIPHSFNALVHYLGARGEDWLPVTFKKGSFGIEKVGLDNYRNFIRSVGMGWDDVVKQKGTLIDLNRAGAPLVMSGIERARAQELTGKLLGVSLKSEPKFWGSAAQKFGLGKAVDAVKAVYDGSSRFLWSAGDIMMAARIHENEMKGMTREQAMKDASIHMPDYVLQNKLLGMRGLPSMMADPGVFMFGRYHAKVVDSLAHMTMDALGPKSSIEDRRKAFGNIGALVFMGAVLYPAADAAVQKLTGNADASQRRRGPLAPITNIQEGVKGEKTYASTISNLLTLSPGASFITEGLLTNRDFTGRNIVEPKSSLAKQGAQAAEYTAGKFVSPYKTVSDAFNPKSTKHPLLEGLAESVADVKVPTEGQKKGAFKGEQMRQSQAAQRDQKPRGLIEYGVNKVTPATPKVVARPSKGASEEVAPAAPPPAAPKARSSLRRDPLADLGNEIMRGAGQ
jgi:hypothetical protein